MLVCAPTGAGKTNIATLTIINIMQKFKSDFKIIYISPMKALAN
jgi:replicative superfamily II helicase